MSNNSNWCPEIYRSVFVDRHNDDQVRLGPCCQSVMKIEPVKDFDFKTSPYLQDLREKFNQGERPSECYSCWKVEKMGQKSRRQSTIEFYNLPNESTDVILESIDHSATWACNLACIMCGEFNSSSWATETNVSRQHLQRLGRLFQKQNNLLERLDLTHVRKVHFNGGEPMLNNDQIELLEKLDQQGQLSNTFVSYNTNGTVMPSDRIIDLWAQAKLVKLYFSVDAIDQAFEYIRYPGKWAQTSNNLLSMKQKLPGNVIFGFNVTVGAYNLLDLVPLYRWFKANLSTNREGDVSDFCWQLANKFHPAMACHEVKIQAIDELREFDVYQGIVDYLKQHINYIATDAWIQSLNQIDQRRGTNWRKSLGVGKYY